MEFYKETIDEDFSQLPGFNSQRDGILQSREATKASAGVVSIPNGMEFYSTNFAIFLGRNC